MAQSKIENEQIQTIVENAWQYSNEAIALLAAIARREQFKRVQGLETDYFRAQAVVEDAIYSWKTRG